MKIKLKFKPGDEVFFFNGDKRVIYKVRLEMVKAIFSDDGSVVIDYIVPVRTREADPVEGYGYFRSSEYQSVSKAKDSLYSKLDDLIDVISGREIKSNDQDDKYEINFDKCVEIGKEMFFVSSGGAIRRAKVNSANVYFEQKPMYEKMKIRVFYKLNLKEDDPDNIMYYFSPDYRWDIIKQHAPSLLFETEDEAIKYLISNIKDEVKG